MKIKKRTLRNGRILCYVILMLTIVIMLLLLSPSTKANMLESKDDYDFIIFTIP